MIQKITFILKGQRGRCFLKLSLILSITILYSFKGIPSHASSDIPPPKALLMPGKIGPVQSNNLEFLWDRLYPLGWSEDGHFAYAIEPADEACGCYLFKFIVDSSRSYFDKIFEFNLETKSEDSKAPDDIESLWKTEGPFFSEILKKFKIKNPPNFLKTDKKINTPKGTWKISLNQKENKLKISGSGNESFLYLPDPGKAPFLKAEIIGFFQNPSNPESVRVLIKEIRKGWEGPPNIVEYKIIPISL